jgi:hypothetical protein
MSTPAVVDSVPLTAWQKARLLFDCLPVVFLTVAVALFLTILRDIVGPPKIVFLLVMGLAILATAHRSMQRLRDVVSGVAVAQDDRLIRLMPRRSRGSGHYYGHFEQLGRLRIVPRVYFRAHPDQRYRVYYSPASRIVWSLERLD